MAREAHAAGLSGNSIAGALRRRQIIAVAPRLYAVREGWVGLTPQQLHLGMARAGSVSVDTSVVSHLSAALVHGLPHPLGPLGPVSLTLPSSLRTAARDDWRRLLDGALPSTHVTEVSGIPVTTPDRTVLDCFRQLRLRDALAVADGALRSGLTHDQALRDMRGFQSRWAGVTKADAGLAMTDSRRESWLESASVATACQLGFSLPKSQVWIHHMDGRLIGRVDFVWPHSAVVGEADGRGKYLGTYARSEWDAQEAAEHMVAERDRERELEAVGLAVARWDTAAVLGGGTGLATALREARRRADPHRVECLWRQDPGDDLLPWQVMSRSVDGGDGPRAA